MIDQPTPKSTLLPILLAVLTSAVVFGSLGYYIASQQSVDVSTTDTSAAITDTTPSSSPTTTAGTTTEGADGMMTYESLKQGFSFKYKKTLTVDALTDTTGMSDLYISVNDRTAKLDTDKLNQLSVYSYASLSKLDDKKLGATSLNDYLTKSAAQSDPIYQNVKAATIGGKSGFTADAGPNKFGGGSYTFVELSDGRIIKTYKPSTSTEGDAIVASITYLK